MRKVSRGRMMHRIALMSYAKYCMSEQL